MLNFSTSLSNLRTINVLLGICDEHKATLKIFHKNPYYFFKNVLKILLQNRMYVENDDDNGRDKRKVQFMS